NLGVHSSNGRPAFEPRDLVMPQAYSRPHFAISSLSSPLFRVDDLVTIAADWRFDGVDLDLNRWWSRKRHSNFTLPSGSRRQTIHSIWLTPASVNEDNGGLVLNPAVA